LPQNVGVRLHIDAASCHRRAEYSPTPLRKLHSPHNNIYLYTSVLNLKVDWSGSTVNWLWNGRQKNPCPRGGIFSSSALEEPLGISGAYHRV